MKIISGKAYLQELHYDIGLRLRDNNCPKETFAFIKKRLKLLEHHPAWMVIDWEDEGRKCTHQDNPFMEFNGSIDIEPGIPGEQSMKLNINWFKDFEPEF